MLKSYERTRPTLGYPRETDSLCPECVKEVRTAIIEGRRDLSELVDGGPGEIKATLVEEDGHIKIRKWCEIHGEFEDLLSMDSKWTEIIESRFPGRDYQTFGDEHLRRHGTSSIK